MVMLGAQKRHGRSPSLSHLVFQMGRSLPFIKLGRKTGTLQGSGCKPVALAMFLDVNPLCANE
jgi:hypothetical protein